MSKADIQAIKAWYHQFLEVYPVSSAKVTMPSHNTLIEEWLPELLAEIERLDTRLMDMQSLVQSNIDSAMYSDPDRGVPRCRLCGGWEGRGTYRIDHEPGCFVPEWEQFIAHLEKE